MALTFTGSSYLTVASVPASQTLKGSPFTLAIWVYPTASGGTIIDSSTLGNYLAIVGAGRDVAPPPTFTDAAAIFNDSANGTWFLDIEQNEFVEELDVQGDSTNVNAWVHYCATYSGSNTNAGQLLYKNGVLISNTPGGAALTSTIAWHDIVVGGFNGDAQDAWVFNRALTANEIIELYRGRTQRVSTANIVGHWPLFADTPGLDISGQGRNLSTVGSVVAASRAAPVIFGGPEYSIALRTVATSTTTNVAGTLADGSALAGAAVQTLAFAGALADGSALAGTLQARVAGALADGSALAGAAVQTQPVAGALADGSALAGALQAQLAGALADGSALAGAAVQAQVLAGALADGSALAGAAVQAQPVAGALADGSALSGSVSVTINLAGALATGSALVGGAVQTQVLAGALASSTRLAGAAVQAQPVAGALATGSALAGNANTNTNIAGALADGSALVGAVVQTQRAAGSLADSSALLGTLTTLVAGALASSSRLTGALTVNLTGAAASGSALAGVISIGLTVAGDARTGSALTGTLTGGSAVVPYTPSGWFDGGDIATSLAIGHTPWREESTSMIASTNSPWREETASAIVSPHSNWSQP